MPNDPTLVDSLIAAGLFGGLVLALELCYFFGQRARRRGSEHLDALGTIQAATLGLLALLLGFSFALAAGRFADRNSLIVQEANAIGTAWLRSDLLPETQRAEVRGLLRRYVEQRRAFYDAEDQETLDAVRTESERLQGEMWRVVAAAGRASPPVANVLWPPFNELFDLHSTRVAAAQRHLPAMVLVLLLACSLVAVAAVGYGCGVAGKRNLVLTTALAFLISGTLWAVIDMDHPRRGLIRVGQQPMVDLQKSLSR